MKIVFFGTPNFAIPALKVLEKIPDTEILAVVTQPDKPVGRKKIITPPPVKKTAIESGLKGIQPKTEKELKEELKNTKADFFIVIAYGMILPEEILKIPKYGAINVHASLLPKYRGASPIQESLLNGDKETGISIMKMDEKLDHGPVYMIRRMKIGENDNLETLTEKLSIIGSQILPPVLNNIIKNEIQPFPQDHKKTTHCRKIKKEDGKINWKKHNAEQINNMIKAYTPWPSVYTDFNGKKLKIWETKTQDATPDKSPGTFFLDDRTLKIATKKGTLLPQKLQIEGKKEMNAETFINGYQHHIAQPTTKKEPAPDKEK